MAKFHVNSNTGSPGRCSAKKGRCPFGGENEHFSSPKEASDHFENEMKGQVLQKYTKDLYMSKTLMNPPSDFVLDKVAKVMPMATHPKVQQQWKETYAKLDEYERKHGDPRDVKIRLLDFSKHARETHKMRRLRDGLDSVNNGRSNISHILANGGRATKFDPSQSFNDLRVKSNPIIAGEPGSKEWFDKREAETQARQAKLPPIAQRPLDLSDEDNTYFQLEEDFEKAQGPIGAQIQDGKIYNTKIDSEGQRLIQEYDKLKRHQNFISRDDFAKVTNPDGNTDRYMEAKMHTDEKMREFGQHMTKLQTVKDSASKLSLASNPSTARKQIESDFQAGKLPKPETLSSGDKLYGKTINDDDIKEIENAQKRDLVMKRMMKSGDLYSPEYEENKRAENKYSQLEDSYKKSLDTLTRRFLKS